MNARGRLAALVAAITLTGSVVVGVGGPQPASAVDPLTYAVGRSVIRIFSQFPRRAADYDRINENRNEDLQAIADRGAVVDYQRDRGWMDDDAYAAEQARLSTLEQGRVALAEREKQIVRHDYNQFFSSEARSVARNAVSSLTGLDPATQRLITGAARGEDPLSAALAALQVAQQTPTPDKIALAQASLRDVQGAYDKLRASVRDPGNTFGLRIDDLMSRAAGLTGEGRTPTEVEQNLNALVREAQEARNALRDAWKDLTGRQVQANDARFARDQKWLDMNANLQALAGQDDATRAVLAGMARAGMEKVEALLATGSVKLSDEDITRILAELAGDILRARNDARAAGDDPNAIDTNKLLRDAVNRDLATRGLDPLPEPGDTPTATATVPGSPTATASPGSDETPVPTATKPATATATAPPPTPTVAATPTPTLFIPTATPTPTPTPTPVPKLPIITVGGAGFADGNGFSVTVTLVINLQSGGVSGSITGQKTSDFSVTCRDPQGNILDVAQAVLAEGFSAGVGGGVSADGGFSAAYSGTAGGAFTLTVPFDVEGCIGREPAFPAAPSYTVSGTLSGSATEGGAVSISSSSGGSWSGSGSVSY